MLAYTLTRAVFFVANREYFDEVTASELARIFWGGLRFDLSAVLYTNALVLVVMLAPFKLRHHRAYGRAVLGLFLALNGVALAINLADVAYYRFTLHRTTAAILDEFRGDPQVLGVGLGGALEYWWLTLAWVACMGPVAFFASRIRVAERPFSERGLVFYPLSFVGLLAFAVLSVVGMRGGFFQRSHRPINPATAGKYVDQPHHTALVVNTPFVLIRTVDKKTFDRARYFADEAELARVFDPVHRPTPRAPAPRSNVVVIILESFGREHVGFLNRDLDEGRYQGFTPFLDRLAKDSLVFTNAWANGRKSIDALPSVISSVPSLLGPFITSQHSTNRTESLAAGLRQLGYSTAFFHGARNGSMSFDAFARLAGFERYVGMNEYDRDEGFDGTWGVWDEPFLQFTAAEFGKLAEPFFATVFTLSSHHPFNVPSEYEGKLRTGKLPLQQCIHYTDQALEKFFATASKQPWFEHTVFVLTADHSSATVFREYKNTLGRFAVPLLIYAPGEPTLRGVDDRPAQQADIMPTVLHRMGYARPFVAFGNDLLDPHATRMAVSSRDGTFQLVQGDYVLHHDGVKPLALFRYRTDRMLEHDVAAHEPAVRDAMARTLEAVLQQFTNRMLDDQMAVR